LRRRCGRSGTSWQSSERTSPSTTWHTMGGLLDTTLVWPPIDGCLR
jgi:hypothetical protein